MGGGGIDGDGDGVEALEAIMHTGSARFHEILSELGQLHDKKQADYGTDSDPFANVRGSEEWGVPAWVGALVRGNDKIRRLQAMVRKGRLENESVEDSMRDLAVYSIIALVLYEEGVKARRSQPPMTKEEEK